RGGACAGRSECLRRDAAARREARLSELRLSELTLDDDGPQVVRDAWGAPAPPGVWGELHVDGRPTGERARRLPDGRLHRLGRLADVVIRRPCRVWPAEGPERLPEHPELPRAPVTASAHP